jgi:hypothetical protein
MVLSRVLDTFEISLHIVVEIEIEREKELISAKIN